MVSGSRGAGESSTRGRPALYRFPGGPYLPPSFQRRAARATPRPRLRPGTRDGTAGYFVTGGVGGVAGAVVAALGAGVPLVAGVTVP